MESNVWWKVHVYFHTCGDLHRERLEEVYDVLAPNAFAAVGALSGIIAVGWQAYDRITVTRPGWSPRGDRG